MNKLGSMKHVESSVPNGKGASAEPSSMLSQLSFGKYSFNVFSNVSRSMSD